MAIKGIYSILSHHEKVYSHIVLEWEDAISKAMNIPIYKWGAKLNIYSRLYHHLGRFKFVQDIAFGRKGYYLRFVMNAMENTPLFNHKSIIPIIIDFYVEAPKIPDFIKVYDNCEYVCITSKQVYDILKTYDLPFKIIHLPFTLSDIYKDRLNKKAEKKYALTLFGDQINDMLFKSFISKYCKDHPDFEYVYKKDNTNVYITNHGKHVVNADTRERYLELLYRTKVVIYSTPGIRGRKNANGYDQVTPKLLEYIASQCHIIPRYSLNSDTIYYGLPNISTSIDSYKQFEDLLDTYLQKDIDIEKYNEYMQSHYTSSLVSFFNSL